MSLARRRSPSERRQAACGVAARPAAGLLAPVLLRQGARVRRTTPVLPEAAGARAGREGPPGSRPPLRLLVLGESTAAGVGVEHQRDGLPRQLAVELSARCDLAVDWQVRARTGATATACAREVVAGPLGPQDLVVLVLGVNDTLRLSSRRNWGARIIQLLDLVQPQLAPQGQVLLAGVPDLGAFPALPRPLRTVLGWHARSLDQELGTLASRRPGVVHAPAPAPSGDFFATDGFHPNAGAYARWAQHLAESVVAPATAHADSGARCRKAASS